MNEIERLLERQARWQKRLRDLAWPEKVRMAQAIRDSVARWSLIRKSADTGGPSDDSDGTTE